MKSVNKFKQAEIDRLCVRRRNIDLTIACLISLPDELMCRDVRTRYDNISLVVGSTKEWQALRRHLVKLGAEGKMPKFKPLRRYWVSDGRYCRVYGRIDDPTPRFPSLTTITIMVDPLVSGATCRRVLRGEHVEPRYEFVCE